MKLVDFLDQSPALSNGDAGFIDLDNDLSLTYQEMVNASLTVAGLLTGKGVKPQDVVATYAPNSVAAYCCIFAISRVGAVWLPLNARNTFEANLKLLKKSNASMLFVDESISASVPELDRYFPEDQRINFNARQIGEFPVQSFGCARDGVLTEADNFTQPDDDQWLVSLLATGGTTGDSKLAEWTDLTWQTMASIQMELMPEPDIPARYLVCAPMTHAAGISSFACMLQGASILVMNGMVPAKLLSAIETRRVTHLFLPPTAIYMLLAHEGVQDHDFSSLRYFWYAAAPMSAEKLKEAMAVFGPVMVQTYGQVEAPMLCTVMSAQDHVDALENGKASRLRSCGTAPAQVELTVLDDEGNVVPAGEEGEIAVRGDLLMRRYYESPEATEAIRMDDGWQRTGDIGVLDDDAYLSIVDRKHDMIISGGFNIYPGEIEQLLWAHPAIRDCAVIGIPDDKWGEQVTAVIELKDNNNQPDEQDIITYCKTRLGSVKAPKQVLFWEELPRSPVGKVLKKEIRSKFWGKSQRQI